MKISVITVNLNNLEGLRRTINSVLCQTTDEFEFIIVDGGSTDGSAELIQKYSPELSWWISEKDNGIYDAMNKGISHANGEYLLFLNSGDCLVSGRTLERVLPFLSGTDIVYGDMKINDKGTITSGYMPDLPDVEHMIRDTLWHPVSFIRKELFERYGNYSTAYRICSDYDFFMKVLFVHQVSTRHINEFIAEFQLDGISSHSANAELIREEKRRIQNLYLPSDARDKPRKSSADKRNIMQNWLRRWFR